MYNVTGATSEVNRVVQDHYLDLLPSVPGPATKRTLEIRTLIPFDCADVHYLKYGYSQEIAIGLDATEVNGLLKFARETTERAIEAPPNHGHYHRYNLRPSIQHHIDPSAPTLAFLRYLPWGPAGFGRGFSMSAQERNFIKICEFH